MPPPPSPPPGIFFSAVRFPAIISMARVGEIYGGRRWWFITEEYGGERWVEVVRRAEYGADGARWRTVLGRRVWWMEVWRGDQWWWRRADAHGGNVGFWCCFWQGRRWRVCYTGWWQWEETPQRVGGWNLTGAGVPAHVLWAAYR